MIPSPPGRGLGGEQFKANLQMGLVATINELFTFAVVCRGIFFCKRAVQID